MLKLSGIKCNVGKTNRNFKQVEIFGASPDIIENVTDLDAITAVLGTIMMPISHVLQLDRRAVVELKPSRGKRY